MCTFRLSAVVVAFTSSSVGVSATARAEPIIPRPDNLHISVACADYWADPEQGLLVTSDGVPLAPRGFRQDGSWTGRGYLVEPGTHELAIDAPGCAPITQQVVIDPFADVFASGRLPISDASLRTPTGAPDGGGVVFGLYNESRAAHPAQPTPFAAPDMYDPSSATGVWLSGSYEHRGFAFAFDSFFGGGSTRWTDPSINASGSSEPPVLTGGIFELGAALRVGARMPLGSFAIAAGGGLGGSLWISTSANTPTNGSVEAPEPDGDWYVPLWTAGTYKTSCNWGAQLLASYQVHPSAMAENAPSFAAGLIWQPSGACSEPAGIVYR